MKFIFFVLIFVAFAICDPTIEDIKEAIKNKKFNVNDFNKKNIKNLPPTVVVFYFEPDKVKDREMYSYYLKEFLSTFGITVTRWIHGKKDELIATLLNVGDDFDKTYVTKTFKGVIKDVLIRDFTKDL